MNKKGFTLTELLAVIAIIAILSVAAIGGYGTMVNNSKKKTLETKEQNITNAAYKFAKENNVDKKTTISVNKLVVMGYLQPDETSDDGLSVFLNPVTNENMICNTIDLTIVDNEINVKYNKNKKDCSLSNEEAEAGKIKVTGYCYTDAGHPLGWEDNKLAWTSCGKVFLRTNPNGLTESNIESITFDYDGNSVVNKTGTMTGTNVTTKDGYKNIMFVDAIPDNVLKTDVGITYTMKDGKVYYRHVVVRIDQQKPSITYVLRNDTIKTPSGEIKRDFDVYVDDASGSGSKGFYLTNSPSVTGKPIIATAYKKKASAAIGEWYITPEDNVGNRGDPKKFTIENIPGDLGCTMEFYKNKDNPSSKTSRTNDWYNHYFWVKQVSPSYDNGVSYDISKGIEIKNRGQLTHYAKNGEAINYFHPEYQGNDMEITTFYGGLWNVQNKDMVKCIKKGGIDTEPPIVKFSPNSNSTHKQSHEVTVTIEDVSTPAKNNVISGFYTDGSVTYTLRYAWAKKGVTPTVYKTATLHVDNYKTLSVKINDRKDVNNVYMTGEYYLWVFAGSVQDKAQNNNVANKSGAFKLDNTPPKCVSSGGITYWVNYNITLKGTCTDQEGGETDQAGCAQRSESGYTYDADGCVYRLYNYEIDSPSQSPGTVYDKAGNSTYCLANQHTHIDLTKPTCSIGVSGTAGDNGWYKSKNVSLSMTKDDRGGSQMKSYGLVPEGTSYNSQVTGSQGDTTGVTWYGAVLDNAGNSNTCSSGWFKVDKTNPSCTYTENSSWTKSNVTIRWGCSDDLSQCATAGDHKSFTGNNSATKHYSLTYHIKDNAGNKTDCSKTMDVYHDEKDPGCSISHSGSTGYWSCSDGHSGVSGSSSGSVSMSGSSYTVSHTCTDNVGNTESCSHTYTYGSSSACGAGFACHSSDTSTCSKCGVSPWECGQLGGNYSGSSGDGSNETTGCCSYSCQVACSHTCYPTCWH